MTHSVSACEARLQALPNYDRFRCKPPGFICSCGRHWIHVCDEAEGCFWVIIEKGWFARQQFRPVHLPQLLSREFMISTSEARRCLAQGAVRLDGTVVRDLEVPRWAIRGKTLRLGKRREVQL